MAARADGQNRTLLMIGRREFMIGCGAGAAGWPSGLPAQHLNRIRRMGVLVGFASADEAMPYTTTLENNLRAKGWAPGENLQIAYRWAGGAGGRAQTYASELVALKPDVLLGVGTGNLVALSQQTRTIPIVFMQVTNPERDGFVASLARPGGNITGISNPDVSIVGERIKVLKEIAPRVTRILALFEPEYPTVPTSLRTMEATAAGLGMTVTPAGVRSVAQVEQAIEEFARAPNGGLAVIQSSLFATARERITALALRHGLPGMFHLRSFVTSGGLASYGIDLMAMYAQVPSYLDRVLKGGNPAEMPVQEPDKSEFIINLKTAGLLGLDISQSVIGRTSAVIE